MTSTTSLSWIRRIPWALLVVMPLVLGAVVGVLVAVSTERAAATATTAVLSTRPASSIPNERVDLLSDLQTSMTLSAVLDEVAERHGLSSSELRQDVTFARIEASSFARMTFVSTDDAAFREEVIGDLLDTASTFLTPPSPSTALTQARRSEKEATDAYYAALRANGGLSPSATLTALQNELASTRGEPEATRAPLRARVLRAINRARQFELLTSARQRSTTVLQSLSQSEATRTAGGPRAISISYEAPGAAPAGSMTESVPARRGLSAGLATTLVLVGFVLAIAWGRRRRGLGADDERGDRSDTPATT